MESWSNLPAELLVAIAMKVKKIEDFTALRGVCTWWRSAAGKDVFKVPLLIDKVPLLMIPGKMELMFLNIPRHVKVTVEWPVPESDEKRCMDARFGWIIALTFSGGESYLFNPLSSSRIIQLPSFRTFPRFERDFNISNVILSANPRETSNFTVFAVMSDVLGYWKNGDDKWSMIESEYPGCGFTNIGYCGTKLYAADSDSRLWRWGPSATELQLVVRFPNANPSTTPPYIVESTAGDLLLITRDSDNWSINALQVDAVEPEWKPTNDIGKNTIFIDQNTGVSFAGDDLPRIKPNHIYAIITEQLEQGHGTSSFRSYLIAQKKTIVSVTLEFVPRWFFPA